MTSLQLIIQRRVHRLVGFGTGEIDLDRPVGDPGLFGPGSAAWVVHGDFTAMMVGGITALMLQMLHPGALAGVWDHSNFREDTLGRLRRTAQFISGTTFGARDQALGLIERVRTVHNRVHGTLPDGTPYSAHDPDLLTWVHVAEVSAFLAASLRYKNPEFSEANQDRYFAEVATIAERLGARAVPKSRAEVEAYFTAVRPQLRFDERTREVATVLLTQPAPVWFAGPSQRLFMNAGLELLPDWALSMHGFSMGPTQRGLIRTGVRGMGSVLRWAVRDGAARRARERTASVVQPA